MSAVTDELFSQICVYTEWSTTCVNWFQLSIMQRTQRKWSLQWKCGLEVVLHFSLPVSLSSLSFFSDKNKVFSNSKWLIEHTIWLTLYLYLSIKLYWKAIAVLAISSLFKKTTFLWLLSTRLNNPCQLFCHLLPNQAWTMSPSQAR